MESLLGKIITAAITGILLYLSWSYILPYMSKKKANFVRKAENNIEKRGLFRHYKVSYRIIKTFLYIVLALMILLPVLFFLMVLFSNR